MTRGRARTRSTLPWLIGAGVIGGYFLLTRKASASEATTPNGAALLMPPSGRLPIQTGTYNIPELPGAMAPTATEFTDAASFWTTLGAGDPLSSGYVNFPSGSQAAAAAFQTRYDPYGSAYVQWAGSVYILIGPDSMGNYTATRVMV